MDPLSKTPEQILDHRISDKLKESGWHFFQCRSWLDLAKRTQNPSALQYAALELRYGIEYLLFELLVLSSESFSQKEYAECIGDAAYMKKLLGERNANYEKNADFTEILVGLVQPHLRLQKWKLNSLFKAWSEASHYLHFFGSQDSTHRNDAWIVKAFADFETTLDPIWKSITEYHGMAAMNRSRMVPDVQKAWDEYLAGSLSREDLILRLKLRFPNPWVTGTQL